MIPAELRDLPQWLVWRAEIRDEKVTKVPYRVDTPHVKASVDDPATWGTYERACRVRDVDGIGFVFSASDPYVGVDLDICVDEEGEIHDGAWDVVRRLGGYVERSPSGRGLHVIVRAELRGDRHRTSLTPWGGVFEVYDRDRYFTMNDTAGGGVPTFRQAELNRIVAELLPARAKEAAQAHRTPVPLDDQELLDRMFASRRGGEIRALYDGAGADRSAGDLALCNHLVFWLGGDPERIDRVFRSSGRMRGKWERDDYRARTIERALAETGRQYMPRRSREMDVNNGTGMQR